MFMTLSWRSIASYFCLLCILINILYFFYPAGIAKYSLLTDKLRSSEPKLLTLLERWIVITSIADHAPNAVLKLLEQPDWLLVVVADKKGPREQWAPHPRLHFLSLEDQMALGYRILQHVPYNSYTRS
ncbi:unnamed protein product [Gongylonema pulchrum]|uniref:UDP-Gal or UDP-GlcNAc-dependent glycosyltransferase n=1 Tax=Gongylonema pulchrum TaxID=637853 RepID=A0A183EFY8_9BILA|nr:unnamed protein product [Gongylonema pulchrum]